eukprot:3987695-Pleurochrysis_carterae.AAC.2
MRRAHVGGARDDTARRVRIRARTHGRQNAQNDDDTHAARAARARRTRQWTCAELDAHVLACSCLCDSLRSSSLWACAAHEAHEAVLA